jgi:hypothetical protein
MSSESGIETAADVVESNDNADRSVDTSSETSSEQPECLSDFSEENQERTDNSPEKNNKQENDDKDLNASENNETEQVETTSESPEIETDQEGNFEEQGAKVNTEPYKYDSNRPDKFEHNSVPDYNSEYFDNGYKFRTEDNPAREEAGLEARIIRTEGQVKSEAGSERNAKAQKETPDKIRDEDTGRSKDHAGHLHQHEQGGPNERGNLVAQDGNLNQGEWKQMENRCAKETENGNSVYRTIDVHYPDDTTSRPDYFDVSCHVSDENGEHLYTFNDRFYNSDKDSREEIYAEGVSENESETAKDTHTEEKRDENRKIAALFGNVED